LFDDLNPSSSGNVSYKQLSDRVVVTWAAVPEYNSSSTNTFQVEMYFDGSIRLSWLSMAARDGIVGLSAGLGEPEDFEPSDLSGYESCDFEPVETQLISGYVSTSEGVSISSVVLTFSNAGGSTVTNSSGYYSHTVVSGWSGTATPSKAGYSFDPLSRSYSNVTSDISGQDYTGYVEELPEPEEDDYFTERFSVSIGTFDLSYKSLLFTPIDSSYSCCISDISALPTEPSGGTSVSLGDDDYEHVYLSGQDNVWIYGSSYSSFYIGSNGYITFTQPDSAYSESYAEHFDTERISVLFDDLNPSSSGDVSYKQLSDRVVVTWAAVPEYSSSSTNTFQVEMYFDGSIQLSWLSVASNDSIVGLSAGLGEPDDFEPSDLSEYPQCGQ